MCEKGKQGKETPGDSKEQRQGGGGRGSVQPELSSRTRRACKGPCSPSPLPGPQRAEHAQKLDPDQRVAKEEQIRNT